MPLPDTVTDIKPVRPGRRRDYLLTVISAATIAVLLPFLGVLGYSFWKQDHRTYAIIRPTVTIVHTHNHTQYATQFITEAPRVVTRTVYRTRTIVIKKKGPPCPSPSPAPIPTTPAAGETTTP